MKQNWQEWIDRIGNQDVTEEELRDFQKAIQEEPEGMDHYMDALLTETSLELNGDPLVSTLPTPAAVSAPVTQPLTTPVRNPFLKFAMPAAAAVALMVGLSYYVGKQQPAATAATSATDTVATITDTNPAADKIGMRIGQPIAAGEFELPENAEIGIAMAGGARLQINGPASFRIDSADKLFLHKGRIQTYAPEYAHGFSIDTKEGEIVDLGTRFVATSGTDAGTEIHVLEGLVKARTTENNKQTHFIGGEQAAILNKGIMTSTDFLAHRLDIPLNPVLADLDGDRVPDVIEMFYHTKPGDPKSSPDTLRIHDAFSGYEAGALKGGRFKGKGKVTAWMGKGNILPNGLTYKKDGMELQTSGGCLQTVGEKGIGATIIPDSMELPKSGQIYISFLMQQPGRDSVTDAFSGILLYKGDYKEEFFIGEIHPVKSYGSRFAASPDEDSYAISPDNDVHLFVVRIDLTRKLTDVFVDPPLHKTPKDILPNKRYQSVPEFDRLQLRSGSDHALLPVLFDEVRIGLTWKSVLPVK